MSGVVAALGLAAVKGTRWMEADRLRIGRHGAVGDREFLVIDGDRLLLTTRNPRLTAITSAWDDEAGVLSLGFPDRATVADAVDPGDPVTTHNYEGRPVTGRAVDGPLAEALSSHLGRRVRLLRRDPEALGPDDAPVTIVSEATVAALAPALDGEVPDARRFRMNVTLRDVEAWAEHGWNGTALVIGSTRLRALEPVPRCAITTRHPDSGARDLPTLKAIAQLRGKRDVTLGIWCEVLEPGEVRLGDAVEPG